MESGQTTVVIDGVGAVAPHIFPSARQQEQEQAAELSTSSLWLCIPAPAILTFSPEEPKKNIFFCVGERGLEPALGMFVST